MSDWAARALAPAAPSVAWLDDPDRPDALAALAGNETADLCVVGGGYSGLWTALIAKERDPDREVVLLEASRCGDQASGRNGGFVESSLTHGFDNGLARWPEELETLERLGAENLARIGETIETYGIDCNWQTPGMLSVATQPHQVSELREAADVMGRHGQKVRFLDADEVRREVKSPTYLAGLEQTEGCALVEPAHLAWGIRRACLERGVRIFENTPALGLDSVTGAVDVRTAKGRVRAAHVALATNAFPPLLRRLRLMTVPVYDYVLMTEPLTSEQRASIGWERRQGVGDAANLFHYYRLTRDGRILWGGYDAVYHYGSKISPALEMSATHETLARHFFTTFPQLEGLRFGHRWGGVIDTCTRFSAFFGTAYAGRVTYALGFTGLGVGATRFGAEVMLDLLSGEQTERTALRMVREKPLPFPPEPFRAAGINLTRWSLERSDQRGGRRNVWLRSLDRLGLGFDS
jgi:glycine/D-amino acid oxidase-like deaminating enzyme